MKSQFYNLKLLARLMTVSMVFNSLTNLNNLRAGLTENQAIIINSDDIFDLNDDAQLRAPINFTAAGLQCYLKHVYNHPKYAQEILPNDLSHIVQFLEYGKKSAQNEEYTLSVLRLFHQKFFTLEYINAAQLATLIDALPNALDQTCSPKVSQLATRLIENGINRIIWAPEDRDGVWRQFTTLGQKLANLNKCGMVPDAEDCNDLLTNLVARFSYIVGLIGSDLPVSFYDQAYQELRSGQLTWLQYGEAEPLIASKIERLQHVLLLGSSKAQARTQLGALTAPTPV